MRVSQIIDGNTRRYGGIASVTPDAFADDGMFDVCLMTATGPLSAGRLLGSLLLQRHPSAAVAQYYRAAHIKLISPVTLPLQVDGGSVALKDEEPTAEGTVYEFTMRARAVTMLVPRAYNGALFQPALLASVSPGPALRPVPAGADGHNGKDAKHGKEPKDGKEPKGGKEPKNGKGGERDKHWRVTVLEVGIETLTAARVKNGRVMRFQIDSGTTFDDGSGKSRPLLNELSLITAGDALRVEGHKQDGGGDHAALATHVTRSAQNGHARPADG